MNYGKLSTLLCLTLLLLSACSSPFNFGPEEAETRTPPVFSAYTIAPNFIPSTLFLTALGDSLSQGVGDETNQGGYVGRIAREMYSWNGVRGVIIENTAKRGRRSDQLLAMFQQGQLSGPVAEADYLLMTIGGNDIMRVVKRDLFALSVESFQEEQVLFENRLRTILAQVRSLNEHAPIVMIGVYNPFSLITDEVEEFDQIVNSYNEAVAETAADDPLGCFVPVQDLFVTNRNLVYHTDFFHPNANGYDKMASRIIERMEACGIAFEQEEA